jgi:sec-independent protein translocase protein TatA
MLGLDNPVHLLFLLGLLLLVFGAKRLPEIGRSLGSGLRGFKESLSADPVQPVALEQRAQAPVAEPSPVAASASESGPSRS